MDRDPEYKAAEQGRLTGLARLDPEGRTANYILPGWLWGFDPVKALDLPPEELRTASWVVANPLQRQEARRAFDLWRSALAYDELPTWRTQREGYERFSEREFPVSAGIRIEEIDCNGVPALRVEGGEGPVVLHLHGGGYVLGSARGAVELAARLAGSVGGSALVVDYRLAPKHGFPAALEDALVVYRYLVGEVGAGRVIVTGEDAGGGLAVSLACAARDAGDPLPMAVYVVSPFCDLSLSSASIDASRGADPWLNRDFLTHLAACYIQATDPDDPHVSPVYADLSGLPPLLIHAAAGEALVDDARRLAESAQAAGVETTLTLFEDTVHSFVLFEFLPETRQALAALGKLAHRSAPASVDI
jgi:salicylate hydroxylase